MPICIIQYTLYTIQYTRKEEYSNCTNTLQYTNTPIHVVVTAVCTNTLQYTNTPIHVVVTAVCADTLQYTNTPIHVVVTAVCTNTLQYTNTPIHVVVTAVCADTLTAVTTTCIGVLVYCSVIGADCSHDYMYRCISVL